MVRILGIVLIVVGVLALVYQGFSFIMPEKVFEAGPLTIFADRERTVWIPPVVGVVALASGVVAFALGGRKAAN